MKRFYPSFIFILSLGVISCWTSKSLYPDAYKINENNPPGTVQIGHNLYSDIYEMTNIAYLEFLAWVSHIYGKNSDVLLALLPRTSVWDFQTYNDSLSETYFIADQYHHFPLVGVTYAQAQAYTQWRTDRIAELLLIKKGWVKADSAQTEEHHFTIEGYMDGSYKSINKRGPIEIPVYTLPTSNEWNRIACHSQNFLLCTKEEDIFNRAMKNHFGFVFNTYEAVIDGYEKCKTFEVCKFCPTRDVRVGSRNIHDIANTVDNVSEMVAEEGLIKGGSWRYYLEDLDLLNAQKANIPNCWTGFRNVAHYELITPEIAN